MKIQLFQTVFQKTSKVVTTIDQYFKDVKNGLWQDNILNYRAGKSEKEKIPSITASGTFRDNRVASNLEKHSGIICIDCDAKYNPEIFKKRDLLGADKYIYAFHISVSGFGLALFIKINPSKHLESFLALEKYLADEYQIIIDQSCKDVSRLRFVSYDPEIFINEKSEKWAIYLKKEFHTPQSFNPIYAKDDINYCVDQIMNKGIDITNSYHDWIRVAFSLCSELGESGRSFFHNISKNNVGYNAKSCDNKYSNCLKHNTNATKINTFFWLCKNAGITIKLQSTKRIEDVARVRRKSIGKSGSCKDEMTAKKDAEKYLLEIDGITNSKDVIDKVFNLSETELNQSEESGISQVIEYINSLNIKFNIVTKFPEIAGEQITDKITNSIYLTCRELYPKAKVTKDLICSILESDRIKEYNPFLDFIEKNSHLKPSGNIEKLCSCIHVPINNYTDYVGIFLEKWLLSIIASIHGTYSLLILVLIGEQSTNKTNFFRNLLPEELENYYAESKLDKGIDDEILMSKKLLIIDDEFGGKSKKEAEKLKDLSSKQKITARKSYGHYSEDFKRIAVLGGTSNEIEVINDTTGNRRIIPIQIIQIDFEKYKKIDKTDLFMELYWKWEKIGDGWMLTKQEIAILNENTTSFIEITMEEDSILKHFSPAKKTDFAAKFLTTTQMISFCEGFLTKQHLYHKKFGQILRKLGYNRIYNNDLCNYGFWVLENGQ